MGNLNCVTRIRRPQRDVTDVTTRGVLQQGTAVIAVMSAVVSEVGEELRSKWGGGKKGARKKRRNKST